MIISVSEDCGCISLLGILLPYVFYIRLMVGLSVGWSVGLHYFLKITLAFHAPCSCSPWSKNYSIFSVLTVPLPFHLLLFSFLLFPKKRKHVIACNITSHPAPLSHVIHTSSNAAVKYKHIFTYSNFEIFIFCCDKVCSIVRQFKFI